MSKSRTQCGFVCFLGLVCATWVGCSSLPEMPDVSKIEVTGKANEAVYVSYSKLQHKAENGSTSNSGSGNYGVEQLDDQGNLEIKLDGKMTGLKVVIVGLSDDAVTVKVIGKDGSTLKEASTAGKLKAAAIQLGYAPQYEPDDPMYDDPEDHIYEARQYLEEQEKQATEQNEENGNDKN